MTLQSPEASQSDEPCKSEMENSDVVPDDLPLEARLERADQLLAL